MSQTSSAVSTDSELARSPLPSSTQSPPALSISSTVVSKSTATPTLMAFPILKLPYELQKPIYDDNLHLQADDGLAPVIIAFEKRPALQKALIKRQQEITLEVTSENQAEFPKMKLQDILRFKNLKIVVTSCAPSKGIQVDYLRANKINLINNLHTVMFDFVSAQCSSPHHPDTPRVVLRNVQNLLYGFAGGAGGLEKIILRVPHLEEAKSLVRDLNDALQVKAKTMILRKEAKMKRKRKSRVVAKRSRVYVWEREDGGKMVMT